MSSYVICVASELGFSDMTINLFGLVAMFFALLSVMTILYMLKTTQSTVGTSDRIDHRNTAIPGSDKDSASFTVAPVLQTGWMGPRLVDLSRASYVGYIIIMLGVFGIFYAFCVGLGIRRPYGTQFATECPQGQRKWAFMWDVTNVYAIPDVYVGPLMAFMSFDIFMSWKSTRSRVFPWTVTLVVACLYIAYAISEVLLVRQTAAQIAINGAIAVGTAAITAIGYGVLFCGAANEFA